jgi:membrane-bound ClpP family serine protease
MSIITILLLILFGFLLFAVEFLVLPGITVAGVGAFLFVGGGIFLSYYFHGTKTGNYVLLGSTLGMVIFMGIILKSKPWQRFGLSSEIEGRVGTLDENILKVGDEGKTVSRLAPIGKAMINGTLYEVRSDGGYLDAHKDIKIVRIDGNKIFVELK